MKTYKEMADSVLNRSEEIIKEKKKRNKKIAGIASAALCCAAILIGIGGARDKRPEYTVHEPADIHIIREDAVWLNGDVSVDGMYLEHKGKTIFCTLKGALENYEKGTVLAISARCSYSDKSFVYKGKTLGEYEEALNEAEARRENDEERKKLGMLLKDGEYLKYGEEIYTSGAPDGVKWNKWEYDALVEYYGEELLAVYIKDGVFYSDRLADDISDYESDYWKCSNEYNEALFAACSDVKKSAVEQLRRQNIRAEYPGDGESPLIIYATAEQFEALTLDHMDCWRFSLAKEGEDKAQDLAR